MTPKSLLSNPLVASAPNEFTEGQWQPVIDDAEKLAASPGDVHRLLLCSGKIYIDLMSSKLTDPSIAVVRVEQLYPFPADDLGPILDRYPPVQEAVWVQEEPEHMGAWD